MQRTIKSFVMRTGRVTVKQQLGLDQWLQDYELGVGTGFYDYKQIFGRIAPVVLEIGFGMGGSLLAMAKAQPDVDFIGIEVHRAGLGSLAMALHEAQLTNVRLVAADAVEVLKTQVLPDSLAGVQVFFPDPWHKKRHNKRRLIQAEFVELVCQKIMGSGFIHCATDWEEYALHMLAVLAENKSFYNMEPTGGFSPRPANRPLTKFEQRGLRLGHGVWDLMYRKK